jgi:hypothetical protein
VEHYSSLFGGRLVERHPELTRLRASRRNGCAISASELRKPVWRGFLITWYWGDNSGYWRQHAERARQQAEKAREPAEYTRNNLNFNAPLPWPRGMTLCTDPLPNDVRYLIS